MKLKAYAKINLTLEVMGRRADGYHDVVTILQTIDLHDTLTLEESSELVLECDRPDLESPENLVLRAAALLREASGSVAGARMTLEKGIPVAAGLGGGSSDGAAALTGLNRLWGLGMTVDELTPLAARLGSDVPFFLVGGTAMAQGRGEQVIPLMAADLGWLVVLAPNIPLENKTATLYGRLTESNMTRGVLTRRLAARIRGGGDVPAQFLFNAFDDVAPAAFPGLDECWQTLHSLGAREIHVAGSGPALYAPVSRREVGTAIQLMLQSRHAWDAYLVSPWQPEEPAP